MDDQKLIGAIFENLPVELTEDVLMFMDMGTVLYLCANNDPLNATCTEDFWERKILKTYGPQKGGNGLDYVYFQREASALGSWRDLALALYSRSLEEMCFECSQYVPRGDIRQCEECGVDLCRLCRDDSEFPLCMDCREGASGAESAGGAARRRYSANALRGLCYYDHGCEDDAEVEDAPITFNDCYKYKRDDMAELASWRGAQPPGDSALYSWKSPDGRCINI